MDAGIDPSLDRFDLAVDAMGGDGAPGIVIDGLAIAATRHPRGRFLVFGDEAVVAPLIAAKAFQPGQVTLRHASERVSGEMKPTVALRLRDSSLRRAIDSVATGEAAGVISAGNSGAMLALAKIVIKTMPGIDRPALAAIGPSAKGDVVMLDLGANLACDPRNLVEFAIMGEVFARCVLGLPSPRVGLLNVGSEEQKGDEKLRQAAETLRASPLADQFHGFVEGHDITAGTTDVVVTDGFSGNIALKTGEGAFRLVGSLLKQVYGGSLLAKIGYLLARPGLERLREWLNPARYNGAVLIGLNGIVVKSHGGADAEGFAHATDLAWDLVTHQAIGRIRDGLAQVAHGTQAAADTVVTGEADPKTARDMGQVVS